MIFRKERVEVICAELLKLSYVKKAGIYNWAVKDGTYSYPDEADNSKEPWKDFDSKADHWTGLDHHYWFRSKIVVPECFDKKPLTFLFKTQIEDWDDGKNPQFLVFINKKPVQGLDMYHREILITKSANADDEYIIDLQAYTGTLNGDLQLIGEMIEKDPQITELYYDIRVPLWIIDKLDKSDRVRIDLELALERTINLLDLRIPYSEDFYNSVIDADRYIKKAVYQDLSGFDDIVATCIGHTHIDVAWWWTVAQAREKVARSFSTALKLMDEYPEYKFMSSQPQLYSFLKQRYPYLYDKVKKKVAEGRWEAEGGMWLEADCNLTSGESLVRQFLYGKKFFKDEFNVDSVILWLPDVFGYSAALPQIMKKSGIKYFMTIKISWNQFDKLPYDTFWWRGIDGSEVFTYLITTKDVNQPKDSFFTTYNGMLHPSAIIGGWDRYQQKDLNRDILVAYGYGDGGGGPTRNMIETGRRMAKGINGAPKVRFETSRKFFDELYEKISDNPEVPKWAGELYLEYHRGTYTSMARNKRSNRKAEIMLQDLEFFAVWAERLGVDYPAKELSDMWHKVLLNQFHDILPGSSIKEVYEVTKKEYAEIREKAEKLIDERVDAISSAVALNKPSLVVLNTLSFTRDDIVEVEGLKDGDALIEEDGKKVLMQKTFDDKYIFYTENIFPKGCKIFSISNQSSSDSEADVNVFNITRNDIETPFVSIKIDDNGIFTSVYDRKNKRELLKKNERGNVLRVYEDKPIYFDNWDIDIYYTEKSWVVDDVQNIEWIEKGPVRATLHIERKFSNSIIRQNIYFYADTPRIDFDTYVDWKEHQHLLKVVFPVDINTNEATYEIQFGNIKRPTHYNTSWDMARFEVCGHKWADISEGGYGMSILNDCKYGHGIHDGNVTLTLIKSGIEPNPSADQEEHWFKYSILPHEGDWRQAETTYEGYKLNVPLYTAIRRAGENKVNGHESVLEVAPGNVIVETVKKAEDGKGIIIRAYEYKNVRSQAEITWHSGFTSAYECDLMENTIADVETDGNKIKFTIKPYEIKTFRIII